jgi:hypothetical protein
MTVSSVHSVNLTGLNDAMNELRLIGGAGPDLPCVLYFVVPPDIFPTYQHKRGSMVPAGSNLPANVELAVLEIPLPQAQNVSAAAAGSDSCSSSSKRTAVDANALEPPEKKAAISTSCNCAKGCQTAHCKCYKNGNRCSDSCHRSQGGTECQNFS